MKIPIVRISLTFAALFAAYLGVADETGTAENIRNFPNAVAFELGDAEFAPGDNITLLKVTGTSDAIVVGGTYCVEGTYTLSSGSAAELGFFATSTNTTPAASEPGQTLRIKQGSGTFRLIKTMHEDGYLHVGFYSGSAFGGIYFGQGNGVLRHKGFSYRDETSRDRGSTGTNVSLAGPNQVLLEYLGNPVAPPANLDASYSKEGLLNAIRLASHNAGITVKRVAIDDTEFPFLIGVVCADADAATLKAQIKKMEGYEYSGSVGNDSNSDGSDTCNVFTIVPYRAYPGEETVIQHRLLLRQQVFYHQLTARR